MTVREFGGRSGKSTRLMESYGVNHTVKKRRSSVAGKKKQIILHIENMSGYDFRTFVERLKNNAYDCIEILKDVLDLLDISGDFIHNQFEHLWLSDLKRKPKMDEWGKIQKQLSVLSPDELKFLFLAYAQGRTPASWVKEFRMLRAKESQLLKDYSHLPNNKAVSLARGCIWDLFLDRKTAQSSESL
jgi:hypothetical protein